MVGVFFDDFLDAPAVGEGRAFLVEVQSYGSAVGFAGCGLDVKASFAVGGPAVGLLFSGFAGDDFDLVGDHEGAVKADAELADEIGILAGVAGELGEKILGAGASDGAEMGDQIFFIHADAGVGEGDGFGFFVESEIDAGVEVESLVGLVGEGEVAELVEGVGGVGDELAEEDFRVGVKRVDDELEELGDFGLEFLFRHGEFYYRGFDRVGQSYTDVGVPVNEQPHLNR